MTPNTTPPPCENCGKTKPQHQQWAHDNGIAWRCRDGRFYRPTRPDVPDSERGYAKLVRAAKAINDHWTYGNFSREPDLWRLLREAICECDELAAAQSERIRTLEAVARQYEEMMSNVDSLSGHRLWIAKDHKSGKWSKSWRKGEQSLHDIALAAYQALSKEQK